MRFSAIFFIFLSISTSASETETLITCNIKDTFGKSLNINFDGVDTYLIEQDLIEPKILFESREKLTFLDSNPRVEIYEWAYNNGHGFALSTLIVETDYSFNATGKGRWIAGNIDVPSSVAFELENCKGAFKFIP